MPVFLGEIEFTDWELPESIPMGGQHEVVVHKTIGGARVVHAMGPDDLVIEWTGYFMGPTAPERALRRTRPATAVAGLVGTLVFFVVGVGWARAFSGRDEAND